IVLTPPTLPKGTLGTAYSIPALTATGGAGGPYNFTLTSGALPIGLRLDPSGALTGTPAEDEMFGFTVQAQDHGGLTGSQNYTLTIDPAPQPIATLQLLPSAGQSASKATLVLDSYQLGFHNTPTAVGGVTVGRISFDTLDVIANLSSDAHDLFVALVQGG